MSSGPSGTANPTPIVGGSGHPRRPGWWWKRRKERLKKQRQAAEGAQGVQEIPTGAYIEELPEDPTVTDATAAPAAQNHLDAGSVVAKKKKIRQKRSKKNKKKVKEKEQTPREAEPLESALETLPDGPVKDFFAQYEGFSYRPSSNPKREFHNLCKTMGWKRGDAEREDARGQFAAAMAFQFEKRYGRDVNDLGAWQRLCVSVKITPVPNDLDEAREAVFNTHVNLVDLTMCPEGGVVQTFGSESELSAYTLGPEGGGIFHGKDAAGSLLYSLLRRINYPPPVGSRRDATNRIIRPNH